MQGIAGFVILSCLVAIFSVGHMVGTVNALSSASPRNPSELYTNNLSVVLTIYGLNSTGQIFAFVNAHGIVQTASLNSTILDRSDNNTDGIGEHGFFFPNVSLKPGEQITACVVVPNTIKMVCATDNKSPYPRPQFIDISLK